jgi:small subunit ribosomal protein S16
MIKLRLARRGRKKAAMYDVVVANSRSPRDGRFIDKVGTYNPQTNPASIVLDEALALKWLLNGAQPTPTVKAILSYRGVLFQKHLQIGVIKGALTQEQADAKFEAWKSQKESKISQKVDTLASKKAAAEKARLDAEIKVNEARAKVLREKQEAEEAARTEAEKAKSQTEKAAADAIKQEQTQITETAEATAETTAVATEAAAVVSEEVVEVIPETTEPTAE